MHGVPGSSQRKGIRMISGGTAYFVAPDHPKASDNNKGWDAEFPLETIQAAFDRVVDRDWVLIDGIFNETVVAPASVYEVRVLGVPGRQSRYPMWQSNANDEVALTIRAEGWHVSGIKFIGASEAASVQLTGSAPSTIIENCEFSGGLVGINNAGAGRTKVVDCRFLNLFDGSTDCVAITSTIAPSIVVQVCYFSNNENHINIVSEQGYFAGNAFNRVGGDATADAMLVVTSLAIPGGSNMVIGNYFDGNYTEAGGYVAGANDFWGGNFSMHTASAGVGDNGITIAVPA
jgi:hypothetical protein